MTTLPGWLSAGPGARRGPSATPDDEPRLLSRGLPLADRLFHGGSRTIGALVLVITASIGFFLFLQLVPTLRAYGLHFFTQVNWVPGTHNVGVAAALVGTILVAVIAVGISVPLALLTALYITEYAPRWLKGPLVSLIDLMAAVPSIVYGIWGFFLLQPYAAEVSRWMSQYLAFFPPFQVNTNPSDPNIQLAPHYYSSTMIAGLVVSMMVLPICCAVMRGVFAQAPAGEREGALALGATRWGVIRSVVLPFGRGGIVGGTMLGLGRALGETIAVTLIISPVYLFNFNVLQTGSLTIPALIALRFGAATPGELSNLLAAGFVLFVLTLVVNLIAATIITRSRSGAATEI
jgi:phosphate transport system permease protein